MSMPVISSLMTAHPSESVLTGGGGGNAGQLANQGALTA
jgi:hypothetical protein